MSAYYNENDPKAAAWLRQLIKDGLIAPGDVDERSIVDVKPNELYGYEQQHFFAGIGGWSAALRLAGWPDDQPVRTGSCPCQPFSVAGKKLGEADERHLWPVFRDLITFGEPTITFGEQTASKDGREWLARVRADLEGLGYAVGCADLCAAGTGSPQIRQRLYWMAHADRQRFEKRKKRDSESQRPRVEPSQRNDAVRCGDAAWVADATGDRRRKRSANRRGCVSGSKSEEVRIRSDDTNNPTWLGDADHAGPQGRSIDRNGGCQWTPWATSVGVCGNDGNWRRVEPSIPPLVTRLPGRVALIRGSGNAIVPQLAAKFIEACCDVIN